MANYIPPWESVESYERVRTPKGIFSNYLDGLWNLLEPERH